MNLQKQTNHNRKVFFKRVFNYFKDIITSFKEAIFGKKEEPKTHESTTPTTEAKPTITEEPLTTVASSINPPQQQAPANNQKPWEKLGIPQEMYKESLKAEQQLAKPVIEPKQQIPEKKIITGYKY